MFKKSTLAGAEADLAALEKRSAGLEARRAAAETTLAEARAARLKILTEADDPPAAVVSKADAAVRGATEARDGIAEALADVGGKIAAARNSVATLKATAEREARATALEASAKAADAAIERMRKAAGELDSARRDLAAALLPEAVPCYAPPESFASFGPSYLGTTLRYDARGNAVNDELDVEQVAARILGHLVTGAMPTLGIARLEDVTKLHMDGQPTRVLGPVDGDAARSLITDPMRVAACKVREGAPDALPSPLSSRETRQRANRWHSDKHGRTFDDNGRRVNDFGLYLTKAETNEFDRIHRLSAFSVEAAREQVREFVDNHPLVAPPPEAV